MDYKLIVIGAGPAGYIAALRAAKSGLKVAVVENREAGGTCLNRGCVPTKTLLHSSRVYSELLNSEKIGVTADNIKVNTDALFARKRAICEKLSAGIETMFRGAKIDFLRGTGKIAAPGQVEVRGDEKVQSYSCENILVATGSVPAKPHIPGLDLPGVYTSDELLEGAGGIPESIVIIGGGVIGVEFANFYNDLGCDVTVIEGMDRLLPLTDREVSQNLSVIFKKRGIKIYVNSTVECVEQNPDGLNVKFNSKDVPGTASGKAVLCAIGRRPFFDGLFADGLEPETDGNRIKVDGNYETSIPGIFAIGDVSSKIQLAHYASAQGTRFADMLCGIENNIDMNIVPGCIYCRPEIASVGMTEAQCNEAGICVKTGKATMFSNAKTVIADGDRAFMKVVAHANTHKVLGAQFMCENATDMISEISEAVANGLTVEELASFMRPHPTFEETLSQALDDLLSKFKL